VYFFGLSRQSPSREPVGITGFVDGNGDGFVFDRGILQDLFFYGILELTDIGRWHS
jgi:hypothetical protein